MVLAGVRSRPLPCVARSLTVPRTRARTATELRALGGGGVAGAGAPVGPGLLGRLLPGGRRGAGPRWAGAGARRGAADPPADRVGRGAESETERGVA